MGFRRWRRAGCGCCRARHRCVGVEGRTRGPRGTDKGLGPGQVPPGPGHSRPGPPNRPRATLVQPTRQAPCAGGAWPGLGQAHHQLRPPISHMSMPMRSRCAPLCMSAGCPPGNVMHGPLCCAEGVVPRARFCREGGVVALLRPSSNLEEGQIKSCWGSGRRASRPQRAGTC